MNQDNTFEVEIQPDGKIKMTSKGAFTGEVHKDADELLQLVQEMAGGETVTKKAAPNLANPRHHHHGKGHHHHHH